MGGMQPTERVPMPPLPGDLLVAAVGDQDRFFANAVILLLESDDTGALGVVLNHIASVDLDLALPGWAQQVSAPQVMFRGGPCEPMGALCLARLDPAKPTPPSFRPVFKDLGLINLDADAATVGAGVAELRIFSGYAGWAPGQLEAEIQRGMWYVCGGRVEDAFTPEPEQLWRQVLRRSPGEAAFLSTWTCEPELN